MGFGIGSPFPEKLAFPGGCDLIGDMSEGSGSAPQGAALKQRCVFASAYSAVFQSLSWWPAPLLAVKAVKFKGLARPKPFLWGEDRPLRPDPSCADKPLRFPACTFLQRVGQIVVFRESGATVRSKRLALEHRPVGHPRGCSQAGCSAGYLSVPRTLYLLLFSCFPHHSGAAGRVSMLQTYERSVKKRRE